MEGRETVMGEKEREIKKLIDYELGADSIDSTATHNLDNLDNLTAGLEGEVVKLDEFDSMFEQALEEQLKYGREDSESENLVRSRVDLTKSRVKDKKVQRVSTVFGFKGYGEYAVDKVTARKLFENRSRSKPVWAVYMLVGLRDAGVCRVCDEKVSTKVKMKDWNVVQMVLTRNGGSFTEPNCILICGECAKVWNPNKAFFLSGSMEEEFRKMCFYLMRRRQERRCGSKPLSSRSEQRYVELKRAEQMKDAERAMSEIVRMQKAQEIDEVELIRSLR